DVIRVGPRAPARLDDHRGIDRVCRLHDGERLLHVVDVESRDAIAALGGMIEELAKRNSGHRISLKTVRTISASRRRARGAEPRLYATYSGKTPLERRCSVQLTCWR